jgi:hypothetical protein
VAAAVLLAGAAAAAYAILGRRDSPPGPPGEPAHDARAMADSQRAAATARDWIRSLYWADLLARADPRNGTHLVALGWALHNYAWLPAGVGARHGTPRNSLERHELQARALALMDSTLGVARRPEQVAVAYTSRGRMLELAGFPVDAVEDYRRAIAALPQAPLIEPHMRWLIGRLADPGSPAEEAGRAPSLPGTPR